MRRNHSTLAASLALVALLAPVLAACGSGGAGGDQAGAGAGEEPEAEAGEVVEVVLDDFAFENLPESVPAGTRFTVVNQASSELHELVAFRLPDGEDRTLEELAALSPGELVGALGEPVTVLLAEPGGPPIPAVGDGTLAEPGRYAIMCFIPTGVDPQEYLRAAAETEEGPPRVEGGPPHFVHGMYAELTVH